MLLKQVKKRWLVTPLTALFLIFSGGAAIAPDCHVATTDKVQAENSTASAHSSHTHTHTHTYTHGPAIAQSSHLSEPLISVGGSLNNEVCFIIGFIVLLLLRFVRGAKGQISLNCIEHIPSPLLRQISRNLIFLRITHIKLGIIRI